MTFNLDDLRGKSRSDQLKLAAQYAGVEPKVMEGIWRTESNYGKAMLSPAGAEGHFGLMPKTRGTWERRLGTPINPNDFTDALLVSAYQVKENMAATKGNVGDALRMYNSGTDRSKWGNKETAAYAAKVLGIPFGEQEQAWTAAQASSTPTHTGKSFTEMGVDEGLFRRDGEAAKPVGVVRPPAPKAVDFLPPTGDRQADLGYERSRADIAKRANDDLAEKQFGDEYGFGDRVASAFRNNSITAAGFRLLERQADEYEPGYPQWLKENLDTVYSKADTADELTALLGATSTAEAGTIMAQIDQKRKDAKIIASGGTGEALAANLTGSLLDPVNLALGIATDGAFTAAGVSGTMALRAGQTVRGFALLGAEGAVGGLAGSGLLEAAGEHQGLDDVMMNVAAGGVLTMGAGVFHLGKTVDPSDAIEASALAMSRAMSNKRALATEAEAQLGAGAAPADVARRMGEIEVGRMQAAHTAAQAEVAQADRLMPLSAEEALTADPAVKAATMQEFNGDLIPDEVEATVITEMQAQAKALNARYPTNPKGLTNVSGLLPGAESTGMTMLKSESQVLQAAAKVLLESTTGAAGRRNTAAMSAHIHETSLLGDMLHWEQTSHAFRQGENGGLVDEMMTARRTKEFNRRVYYELDARGEGKVSTEKNPHVIKGADMVERGYQKALDMQARYKTVGHGRLPPTAKGYLTRRLSVERVVKMAPDTKRGIIDALSNQFQTLNEFPTKKMDADGKPVMQKFDKEFSDTLAKQYINRAVERQHGMFEIPMALHEPQAAEMVEDALEAMQMDAADRRALMGSLARGGAGHTKGRLKMDMTTEVPDGNGGTMPLGDMFEQDIPSLFQSYARRVAGEAALAQHGIMGVKGFKLLKQAVIAEGKATTKEVAALDQVMGEFLNMRVGEGRNRWMDNLNIATSAARLGQAVVNQTGEFSNSVLSLGVARTLAQIPELPRMFKEIGQMRKGMESSNPILRDFDHISPVGMEDYLRAHLADVKDYDVDIAGRGEMGLVSRVIRSGANAQFVYSGHRAMVAGQTRMMSESILKKALWYVKHDKADVALTGMGLGTSLRGKLKANLDAIAKFDSKGRLEAIDLHAGNLTTEDIMSLSAVMHRGAGQIIQRTFIGERGAWAHDSFLGLLYKFRGFGLTSMEKQWSRTTMNHGHAKAFGAIIASMSWALPIQAARVNAATIGMSRNEAEEYKAKNLSLGALGMASANYVSIMGLGPDAAQIGLGFVGTFGGDKGKAVAEGFGQSARGGQDLMGGQIAPGLGVVNDAWKGVHGDWEKGVKALPFSNMLGIRNLINLGFQDDK